MIENKIIPFEQAVSDYRRRVGAEAAFVAPPANVIVGARITRLFDRLDQQNREIDKGLAKNQTIITFPKPQEIPPDILA